MLCSNTRAEQELKHDAFMQKVRYHLKTRLNTGGDSQRFVCQGETICGLRLIPLFYQERDYVPAWMSNASLLPKARPLIQAVQNARQDGLEPQDYHAIAIAETMAVLTNQPDLPIKVQAEYWADLDLLLTDAFLLLGTHLAEGRIDPETLHPDWIVSERSIDLLPMLHTASDTTLLERTINRLRPAHQGYLGLRNALQHLRDQQAHGGWPVIADGPILRPGSVDQRVPGLRYRLMISNDMETERAAESSNRYDGQLVAALKNFQRRHGLNPDGTLGPKTRRALNITIGQRIRQIELNLERWRWLPDNLGHRHIVVNTADFSLKVVENHSDVLRMRVVVGRPARRTPVFSSQMMYMVFNPYWNIPHTIAVEDILPKLQSDVDYLAKQNINVFKGWADKAEQIDPLTVDWQRYGETYLPFRLRQEPGPNNALGQIKFIFPNKFAVYLHDTPQRSLFNFTQRDFSSGCIRLENARKLANYLLADESMWPPVKIQLKLQKGKRQVVRIPNPIPVHLIYMTSWVDKDNRLQFRDDIYDRDSDLNAALMQRPPDPPPPLATFNK
jgi:murein L,D-transpeptidase YcbB/YkuD